MNKLSVVMVVGIAAAVQVPSALAQPQLPKPGPEHAYLKSLVGTWDATVKAGGGESKGVMKYDMGLGGLWLVSDFQGDFGGLKFEGKGLDGYDATKKKYVSLWVDSMSTLPVILEGSYDKDAKTMTMTGEGPGMDGKVTKYKTTTQYKDENNAVFTIYNLDKDGKEQAVMTISYKKREK